MVSNALNVSIKIMARGIWRTVRLYRLDARTISWLSLTSRGKGPRMGAALGITKLPVARFA